MTKIIINFLFVALLVIMEFFAVPRARTEADAKALAENIYLRITKGGNFKTLAPLYCENVEAARNGGTKRFKRKLLHEDFGRMVYALKTNQIAKPFKVEKAYYIVEMLKKSKEAIELRYILLAFD